MNRFEVRESERVDVGVGPGISRYGVYDREKHMFVLDLQKNFRPECADAMNEAAAAGKDPGLAGNEWISLHKKEMEWYEY